MWSYINLGREKNFDFVWGLRLVLLLFFLGLIEFLVLFLVFFFDLFCGNKSYILVIIWSSICEDSCIKELLIYFIIEN